MEPFRTITTSDLDLEAYNAKFAFVDSIMQKDHHLNPEEWARLTSDPTLFCYAFFKLNNNPFRLYPYQDAVLNDKHKYKIMRSARQIGKVIDNDEQVLTMNGWKRHGDLKIGDYVYDRNGRLTRVTNTYPHKDWQFYKITFKDGSHVYAGAEHLWICKGETQRRRAYTKFLWRKENPSYGKWIVRRTDEIMQEGGYSPTFKRWEAAFTIPVAEPIDLPPKKLSIPPYVLGVIIGDGSIKYDSVDITTADKQIVELLSENYILKKMKAKYLYVIRGISKDLKMLGLKGKGSEDKFIPQNYLLGSIEQRKELLKGLMDTDGSIYGASTCEYCTVSERLKDDFVELINSLGGIINKVTTKHPFYYDINREKVQCKNAYSIRFKVKFNPFKLRRKKEKWYIVDKYAWEMKIVSIEKAHVADGSCITVDSEDNSYLLGRNYIVTHNSLGLDAKAAYNLCVDHGRDHNECIISKSLPQAHFQMSRVKQLLNTAQFTWKDVKGPQDSMSVITIAIHDETDTTYQKENREQKVKYINRLVCTPATEGTLGYDFHEANLDEFEYWDVDTRHFYNAILEPTTYATKGRITIFSNPNGADSFVADLEKTRKADGEQKWHVYVFSFLDRPGATPEELEEHKAGKTRQEIESQLLAIRSISDRNYFTPDEIEGSRDPHCTELRMVGKQPYFFLDVGAKHDQSVLVGGYVEPDENNPKFNHVYAPIIHAYPVSYPLSRVVGSEVDESDGWHYEKSVKEHLQEWSQGGIIPILGVDVTGNSGIQPLIESIGITVEDVTFSGPVKSGMYQRFKYLMEKKLLHRPRHEAWEYQAGHLEVKKSQRGYLMIHHEREEDLDDCMDATAGFIYLADCPDSVPTTFRVIGGMNDAKE